MIHFHQKIDQFFKWDIFITNFLVLCGIENCKKCHYDQSFPSKKNDATLTMLKSYHHLDGFINIFVHIYPAVGLLQTNKTSVFILCQSYIVCQPAAILLTSLGAPTVEVASVIGGWQNRQ